jgi:hypothetical protein
MRMFLLPSIIENNQDEIILSELRPKGIEWDSPHIECMEETRLDILKSIEQWVADMDAPNILWLKGHPGVGKSTIAASLVSRLQKSRRLGSSFVFQRERSAVMTTNALWRMVAFDLAKQYPAYRKALVTKLSSNDIQPATANIHNLFRHLIQELLTGSDDIPIGMHPVIVIDALDECGGLEGHYSDDRKGLMQSIKLWSQLPMRCKLIVTSRSEADIEHTFSILSHKRIEISTGQAVSIHSMNDIQAFFEYHFREIAERNSGLSPQWPGSDIIKELVEKAAGLFIWAKTAIRLISRGEPKGQLRRVRQGGITGSISSLYSLILEISFPKPTEDELVAFHAIMGSTILARVPLSVSTVECLLSIDQSMISYIRNGLYSVLELGEVLRIGHQSFADFLIDEKECPAIFHILIEEQRETLTMACLQTMRKELRFNICQIQSSYSRNSDIPGLSSSIERNIRDHLRYSCWYWTDHLTACKYNSDMSKYLRWFMENQILFWLEVMSLTKQVNKTAGMFGSLVNWTEVRFSIVQRFGTSERD